MTYCLSPGCRQPQNPDAAKHCQSCGSLLWLKERYRPIKLIGQGGFGRTFLAVDEDLPSKPRCVIKQLYLQPGWGSATSKAVELFHREASRLDELGHHPQIPTLLAHCEQNQQLYLVQDLIEGKTLKQELQDEGRFSEDQIWELLRDLLPVLQFIHDRHVIHRDIKPANIIRRARDRKPVLIDFGIAKTITDTEMGKTGTLVGSPEYVAPEQNRGKAVPASDLYSLGVTCIHLLTRVSPLDMFDIVHNQWAWRKFLAPHPSISDRLGYVLDKLLQEALGQRYQSVQQVLQDLKAVVPNPTLNAPSNLLGGMAAPLQFRPSTSKPVQTIRASYADLRSALVALDWQKADQETWSLMCQVLDKPKGSFLMTDDINQLPCQVLRTIDWLWLNYSHQRFGFSPQVRIYERVGQDYGQFCAEVGWPTYHSQANYLQFKLTAPMGHLPSRSWAGGYAWWHHLADLARRLRDCGMIS